MTAPNDAELRTMCETLIADRLSAGMTGTRSIEIARALLSRLDAEKVTREQLQEAVYTTLMMKLLERISPPKINFIFPTVVVKDMTAAILSIIPAQETRAEVIEDAKLAEIERWLRGELSRFIRPDGDSVPTHLKHCRTLLAALKASPLQETQGADAKT